MVPIRIPIGTPKKLKNKKMIEKKIVKLKKSNVYSFSITIPKGMIKKYGWREKQKLVVSDQGRGKLEITDWRKR